MRKTTTIVGATIVALCLAARGATPSAFERRCIPPGCVAPPSNTPGILGRRALPPGRLARLGATPDFHHGLLRRTLPRFFHMLFGRALSDLSHLSSADIDAAGVDAHLVSHLTRTPRRSCLANSY